MTATEKKARCTCKPCVCTPEDSGFSGCESPRCIVDGSCCEQNDVCGACQAEDLAAHGYESRDYI